ncbi:C-type natriuretic peptide 2 [Periophthalmus magnuspinnatus]|uniref:C-type natriuretic peptide 2 n=1 Tax=Periophthalmus magnuspinnatus TaxID=409849 RepID=UPI00145AEB22|nr:C-type natriuretic peptide 2 [Periophthalmus magnuspinnatus]
MPPHQTLRSKLGARLSALVLAPPPSHDITEGSATGPAPSAHAALRLAQSSRAALPLAQSSRLLLDLVQGRGRMWRRGRKSAVGGGRGCFGMKMDRIGSISGLGC